MMFSLLPVSAAAADIPDAYKPTIKWTNDWAPKNHSLTVGVINEGTSLGTISEQKKHLSATVKLETAGVEVYYHEASGGTYSRNTAELFTFIGTTGFLKLYTRSTAGHTVTVNYEFVDAPSKNHSEFKNVKYAEEKSFDKLEKDYGYEITVSSGDAKYEVDSLNELWVTGGAEDSEITVTYTPKNVIYIDQYYDNGSSLVKWNGKHITLNGPKLLNGAAEAAVIEKTVLTDDMKDYRFLTVKDVTYDFSFACLFPRQSDKGEITDLWYKDKADPLGYHWFYSRSGKTFSIPWGQSELTKGAVNFCYNTPHTKDSKYHDFVATTVDPTCTERGYTDYECRYCGKEGQREYIPSLGSHLWGDYKQDKNTKEKDSQHYQVCKRCNEKGITENCRFDLATTETGTHTCTVCGHSYTDEITPTETPKTPVYVYFRTVDTAGIPIKNDVKDVKHNVNGKGWATLGKLTTKHEVNASTNKDTLGAEVTDANDKFVKHPDNNGFDLDLISEWVGLTQNNGAAGYEIEAPFGTYVWHLDGKVNVYKLSYNANLPTGVTETVTGMPQPAYYLPNATVSTADPELQGYDFGGWYTNSKCEGEAIGTVTVAKDTVLYAKWTSRAQPTADLIDDAITITHSVNGDPEHGNDDDSTAHIVNKDATISYQATLDMKNLKFGANPEHADDVSSIQAMIETGPLWEFMEGKNITMFDGSKVKLHVKFSDKLVNPTTLGNITLESGWFKLDPDPANKPTYDETTKYWTIPCVIKNAKDEPNTNDSIITLSGITLSLTADAQDELRSDTALDITSGGYIDGTIKISTHELSLIGYTGYTYELSLIGRSQGDPAQNTAKLKTYTVTYDGNGADSGKTTDPTAYAAGEKAKVKDNGFTRSGYTFTGWNMQEDGKGKSYKIGDKIPMTGSVTLYAQWNENSSGGGGDDSKTYYYFAIQKVDAQDGHALNGAKFELYQLDKNGKVVNHSETKTRQHRSENGIALFSVDNKNSYKGIWYYAEVTAPEGYVLDSTEHKITKNDFSTSQNEAIRNAKRVRNYRGTTPDLLNGDDHFAYVVGYQDGCVHPNALITRAETATIFFRLLKDSVRDGNLLTSNTFADVPNDYWANTAISTMAGLGIVQGYNSTAFDPNASITRAEFAAICARFDTGKSSGTQTFSDIKGHWAEKYIERAAELGWIKGLEDGTFRPNDCITRAQAMTMINRVLNRIPEDASDLLPDMNVWPDCNPGDWFYLAVQEATNSHDFKHKAGNYETWISMKQNPDWTRYEN